MEKTGPTGTSGINRIPAGGQAILSILSNTNILSILSEILRSGGQAILSILSNTSILSEILRSGGQTILSHTGENFSGPY